jgi:transcriptional regulator with XRE-family HTH domain
MQEADGLFRFGKVIADRRARLGLTRFEVRDAGGPSDTTLGNIENGTLGRAPSPATLKKLDRGLRWVKGSAADVLAGGEATTIESRSGLDSPRNTGAFAAGPDSIVLPLAEINSLLELHRELNAAHEQCRKTDPLQPHFEHVVSNFNAYVSRVAGRYATAVLERNGGPGAALPPIVEMAFAHLLDMPISGQDPHEREEQLYRRWLAGRLDGVDDEAQARFQERWVEPE